MKVVGKDREISNTVSGCGGSCPSDEKHSKICLQARALNRALKFHGLALLFRAVLSRYWDLCLNGDNFHLVNLCATIHFCVFIFLSLECEWG